MWRRVVAEIDKFLIKCIYNNNVFPMTLKLSKKQKEKIINLIKKNEGLPDGYKDLLFPNQKKEYELTYAGKERKEDIISETMAVPFQKIKTFGQNGNGWTNKLIFGDNLQILKEIYNDQKGKNFLDTKDKIKLIYIDPPFATKQDFMKNGEKVYRDKVIGAEFLEFLRERLILAREILADDGVIYIHLDQKKGHYVKNLLDEIFGENNFNNEIIWRYRRWPAPQKNFQKMHDTIFRYSKGKNKIWNQLYEEKSASTLKAFGDTKLTTEITERGTVKKIKTNEKSEGTYMSDVWEIAMIQGSASKERNLANNYPTQKPEILLERIIKSSSSEGDIVLDFFAGSGTTLAVAEKLNRKWIGCDCGKLAIYTMQKRILNIFKSKDLENKDKLYSKESKPFTLYNAGLYDYKKIKQLQWEEYRNFALNLFEVRDEKHKLSGIDLDGYKGNDHVIIFNHEKHKNVVLDYEYIDDLHTNLGVKITDKFFIIVPAGNVDFLEDYVERGKVRYYILRIPYSIINELHNRDFESIKQPIDEKDVNNTVEAVGFDFIQPPEVECGYKQTKKEYNIKIKKFHSRVRSKKPMKFKNLETLSMVMVDYNYNGEVFDLDKVFFAEDIKKKKYKIVFDKNLLDKKMMIIYMDIFGNEKREIKEAKDFK